MTNFSMISLGMCMLALTVPTVTMRADDQTPPENNTRRLFPVRNTSGNPEAPSRVYIQCTYTTGSISFVLPASIYSTTVDLYNDWYTWSGFVTRDQPVLEIPDLEGTYTIKCNADDGKTYIGTLEF